MQMLWDLHLLIHDITIKSCAGNSDTAFMLLSTRDETNRFGRIHVQNARKQPFPKPHVHQDAQS